MPGSPPTRTSDPARARRRGRGRTRRCPIGRRGDVGVGDVGERDGADAAGPPAAARAGRRAAARRLADERLDEAVPGAAAAALALPAKEGLTAGLADVAALGPRHRCSGPAGGAVTRASTGRAGSASAAWMSRPASGSLSTTIVVPGSYLSSRRCSASDVLDHVLDHPAQRPRAVGHVVAELDDVVLGRLGDLELHLLGAQLVADPGEHQVDDLRGSRRPSASGRRPWRRCG